MRSIVKTFHNPFIFHQAVTLVKILASFRKSHQRLLHTQKIINNKIVDQVLKSDRVQLKKQTKKTQTNHTN